MLVRKLLIASTGIALAFLLLGPWIIYKVALSNIVVLPSPSNVMKPSAADTEAIWLKLQEHGPVDVKPLSPHGYTFSFLADNPLPSGANLAWYVARNYNQGNLKNRRMIWWHMSGAALTIWLTRHWSTEQLISEANKIARSSQSL